MLKFDKWNAAFMGLYIASDLVEEGVKYRRKAREKAINAHYDALEAELRERLRLLEIEQEKARKELEYQRDLEDLSWMK